MKPEGFSDPPRLDGGRMAWRVAIGASVGLAVAFGPAFIASFGLYVKPISAEFGWSRTEVSSVFSLAAILGALGTPLLGFALDRRGSRGTIVLASLLLPLALLTLVVVPDNYALFLGCGVVLGLVSIAASPAAYVSLLPQWFSRRLGVVVALAMFGSGFGQFAMAHAHGRLLAEYDWRSAWTIMAAIVAVVGIPVALVAAHDRPDLRQLRRARADEAIEGEPLRSALSSPIFWTAVPAFFLVMLVTAAMLTHLAPLLSDRGWPIERAAGAVAMIGLVSLVGRAISGALLDRFGFGVLGISLFPLQAVGCIILMNASGGVVTLLAAGLIGLTYGVEADMLPWTLRRRFGLRCFGRLYGIAFGVVQLGSVLGPLMMGASFDGFGSYRPGLLSLLACSLAATLLIAVAARLAALKPLAASANVDPHRAHLQIPSQEHP